MLCSPSSFCPQDSPLKNTGGACHFLLQGIFPTQGSNVRLLLGRQILYHWATWEALWFISERGMCPAEHLAKSICTSIAPVCTDLLKQSPGQEAGILCFNKCSRCFFGSCQAGKHCPIHSCFWLAGMYRILGLSRGVGSGLCGFWRWLDSGCFVLRRSWTLNSRLILKEPGREGACLKKRKKTTQNKNWRVCAVLFENNLRRYKVEILPRATATVLLVSTCFIWQQW